MKEFRVRESEAGQSVWKYITKLMPGASASLLRKSLRKKNITLNDRKLEGKEKIQAGDSIKIWFSDETIDKFMGKEEKVPERKADGDELSGRIVYEDHDVLLVNKPAGLLTQGDASGEKSLNDEILAYLKDEVTPVFKPSVCNRLDRNTSGLVIAGKNIHALQAMNEIIRKRDVRKIYTALVYGEMKGKGKLEGYLKKDHLSIHNLFHMKGRCRCTGSCSVFMTPRRISWQYRRSAWHPWRTSPHRSSRRTRASGQRRPPSPCSRALPHGGPRWSPPCS